MLSLIHALKSSQSTGSALSNIFSVHTAQHMPPFPFPHQCHCPSPESVASSVDCQGPQFKKEGEDEDFPNTEL